MILICSAVNEINYSALTTIQNINRRLIEVDIRLHLSEVKGPVMDALTNTQLIKSLSGDVFPCQYDAYAGLKIAYQCS